VEDPLGVCGFQRIGHVVREAQGTPERERARVQHLPDRLARHQLHDEDADVFHRFEAVDRSDVGMIERRQQLRLALETRHAFMIPSKFLRQNFEGHLATEPRVACPPDLAHATGAEEIENLVRTEIRSRGEAHQRCLPWSKEGAGRVPFTRRRLFRRPSRVVLLRGFYSCK